MNYRRLYHLPTFLLQGGVRPQVLWKRVAGAEPLQRRNGWRPGHANVAAK